MGDHAGNAEDLFTVVINGEEQYSIWRAGVPVPAGWSLVGAPQPRQACLDYIEKVWVDMRPLSLRQAMATGA